MGPCFNSYLSYKFDLARKDMWLSKNKFGLSLCLETLQKLFQALFKCKICLQKEVIHNLKNHILVMWPSAMNLLILSMVRCRV